MNADLAKQKQLKEAAQKQNDDMKASEFQRKIAALQPRKYYLEKKLKVSGVKVGVKTRKKRAYRKKSDEVVHFNKPTRTAVPIVIPIQIRLEIQIETEMVEKEEHA